MVERQMRKVLFAALLLLVFAVLSSAQQQAPPAPPQSPRQALIEMANGGQNGLLKHLTVAVQQLLKQPENKEALRSLADGGSLSGLGFQFFESGPVLVSFNQPSDHSKIEVQVNNDDMSGDQDTLDLSVHSFRDGVEQDEEWQSFVSHFTVTMVRQEGIWRLSKIGVGVDLAVGDPEFLKKTYLKPAATGIGMVGGRLGVATVTQEGTGGTVQHPDMPPNQVAMMLGFAEQSFARQHADVGFTCSLSELMEGASGYGLDPQIANGSYKAYKIALTGCQGKPAGSFQITVEPMPGKGGKAYCTDATQNMRVSDDGRGATCLSAGRLERRLADEADSISVEPETTFTKPKE